MTPSEAHGPTWRTSSYSGGQGNCVEVAHGPAHVLIRDTKDRLSGALDPHGRAWRALLAAVR